MPNVVALSFSVFAFLLVAPDFQIIDGTSATPLNYYPETDESRNLVYGYPALFSAENGRDNGDFLDDDRMDDSAGRWNPYGSSNKEHNNAAQKRLSVRKRQLSPALSLQKWLQDYYDTYRMLPNAKKDLMS